MAADWLGMQEMRPDMKKDKTPAKRGQPTKYKVEFIPIVQNLIERGLTDYQIADTLGVSEKTLRNWKGEHDDLMQAMTRSKEQHDAQVEATLIMKAVGYERKIEKATASGRVVTVTEYFPPSDSAIQFWLRNRKAETYRERQEHITKHEVSDRFLKLLESVEKAGRAERETGRQGLIDRYEAVDAVVVEAETAELEGAQPAGSEPPAEPRVLALPAPETAEIE